MKRMNTFVGGALTVVAVAACTPNHATPNPEATRSTYPSTESTATPRVQDLARSIIGIYDKHPKQSFTGKPGFTVGVTIPLDGGGELLLSTQTPTDVPDPERPLSVEVTQSGIPGGSFDALFLITKDGLWNVNCVRNDNQVLSEQDQKRYEAGNATPIENPAIANAILDGTLMASQRVVNTTASEFSGEPISPYHDVCAINLGDGPGAPQTNT